jgi:iron complex transport system permease protein
MFAVSFTVPQKSTHISPKPLVAALVLLLFTFVMVGVSWGPVNISANEWWLILTNNHQQSDLASAIVFESRLPRVAIALVAGAALAAAGLLMQTIFRNPLAGPSVLGISGGASLAAALLLLSAPALTANWWGTFTLATAAAFGAIALLALVLLISSRFKDQNSILLVGIMLGYLTAAVESMLQFSSRGEALKAYVTWGMGSFANALWPHITLAAAVTTLALVVIFQMRTSLNMYLLGDEQATSLGLSVRAFRKKGIVIAGVLVAVVTAFCGPVGFIGLVAPHVVRLALKTADHRTILFATLLTGSALAVMADLAVRAAGVPLNAVTALIGAPIVLFVILRKNKR